MKTLTFLRADQKRQDSHFSKVQNPRGTLGKRYGEGVSKQAEEQDPLFHNVSMEHHSPRGKIAPRIVVFLKVLKMCFCQGPQNPGDGANQVLLLSWCTNECGL